MMTKNPAKQLALGAVFIALETLLGSVFSLQFLLTKISFSFVLMIIAGYFFSPFMAGLLSGVSYTLGMLLFPKFPFFLGFSFSAFLAGVLFAYCLQKAATWWSIMGVNFLVTFGIYLGFNSWWLHLLYGTSWSVLLTTRTPQEVGTFGIYVLVTTMVLKIPTWSRLAQKV